MAIAFGPRKPWLAVVFGLVGGFAGYAYVGELGLGIVLCIATLAIIALAGWSGFLFDVTGFYVVVTALCALFLGQFVLLAILARRFNIAPNWRWYQRWYTYPILMALSVVFSRMSFPVFLANRATWFGYEIFDIPTSAMFPALAPGDYILVDSRPQTRDDLHRGDIVVFDDPEKKDVRYVKRIVGMPGDRIQIDQDDVIVNGQALTEPYRFVDNHLPVESVHWNTHTLELPSGEYVVIGDNRRNSLDSRQWGAIKGESIHGIVRTIWFSEKGNRIGAIK